MATKKLFTFAKRPRIRRQKKPTLIPKLKDPKDEPPFYIRGVKAGSKDEYWVSLALEKIEKQTGWRWDYQVPLNGGRRRRGGNVADFLVYTPGQWSLLDPMGRVWHTGRREDRFQMEDLCRERGWRLIAWFTDQTPTKELVYQHLRKEFHI
jgi:hypothetical protein